MRWLAPCLVVVAGSVAAAFVVMSPPVVEACGHEAPWDAMVKCLATQGEFHVIRQDKDARLVQITQRAAGTIPPRELGVYLLLQRDHKWRIGGMYEPGEDFEVLGLEPVTIGRHTGWRFDVGRTMQLDVSLDDATSQRALVTQKLALFCPGDGYRCFDAMTTCDVLVHGKAYWSFRGKLSIEHGELRITGDRGNAGTVCAAPERVPLGWPDQ